MSGKEFAYSGRKTVNNAVVFAVGKVFSALATLFWLGLVVRLLGVGEYAKYVAAMAGLETGIAIAAVGLDWVIVRYVPELYVKGALAELRKLILWTAAARLVVATSIAALGVLAIQVAARAGFEWATTWQTYALPVGVLLASESVLRLVRDNTLESLGGQKLTQAGIFVRTTLLIGLALFSKEAAWSLTASSVLKLEIVSSLSTLVLVGSLLARRLKKEFSSATRVNHKGESANLNTSLKGSMRIGLHNYISTLVSYAVSTQVLVLVVSTFASSSTVASFGLVCRLFDISRGYVPALMLMSVLRPRFVGIYSSTKSFAKLSGEAALASRLSMLTVAPIVAVLVLYGDTIIKAVSGGTVQTGGAILAALVATLLLRVHRLIAVVLANCVDLASALVVISASGLIGWPVAILLFNYGEPLIGAVVLIFLDDFVWIVGISFVLRRGGYGWGSGLKEAAGSLIAAVPCVLLVGWIDANTTYFIDGAILRAAIGSFLMLLLYAVSSRLFGLWRFDRLKALMMAGRRASSE